MVTYTSNEEVAKMVKSMKTLFPVILSFMFFVTLMVGCAQKPPTITKVEPLNGPTSGGTTITITGKGFKQNAKVTVGGVAATVTKVTPTTVTATTPAGTAGPAAIVVTNPKAKVGSAPFTGFTYYEEVAVSSTNPDPAITPELETPPAKIDVTFNQDVDPASVSITVATADGTAVEGSVAQDATDTKMFSFTPKEALKAGTEYKVTVSGAKGMVGGDANVLPEHEFSFKVKEAAKKPARRIR